MTEIDTIRNWIEWIEATLPYPKNEEGIDSWIELANDPPFDLEDCPEDIVDRILDGYEAVFRRALHVATVDTVATVTTTVATVTTATTVDVGSGTEVPDPVILTKMDTLCARQQTEQRSAAWYEQATRLLTASELGGLTGSPRARAQLIMSKLNPKERLSQTLAVPSVNMTPFDWGIRFEPVVKLIYEHKHRVEIRELGRLVSQEDERCSASPDGLLYSDPTNERTGRLIEIKCPVTRVPDGKVPKDYYSQIQMQLHVTGLSSCHFVEAVFTSPYSSPLKRPQLLTFGPPEPSLWGEILLIQTAVGDTHTERYVYGPVNGKAEGALSSNETLLETIPWTLYRWSDQLVPKDPTWWPALKPTVDAFWVDVEKARTDPSFLAPLLAPLKKKEEVCAIQLKIPGQPEEQEQQPQEQQEEACAIRLPV